ncbi:DNA photolyase [Marinobacter sp. LV10R510-11A]|uniref:deoxyribodipyrimidine photo-lyase n=1 Tax=Marinobacter sp. LV10R510-11A TaxID=1415568 RepID=UPI000BBF9C47|nr:deoxyribodipyrimidine photo-lyase [Marinobacter sp. LV10R510-11A]SOB77068.1 DNA photolyase [Marinobacter sp. LV10R510-11A]
MSNTNDPINSVVDPRWFQSGPLQSKAMGEHRWRFLWQSLIALERSLRLLGQRLHIAFGEPEKVIQNLVHQHRIARVIRSRQPGTQETGQWQWIKGLLPDTLFQQFETLSLFTGGEKAGLARLQELLFGNHAIDNYKQTRNESTYWLWFELLWREYFYWYAMKHGADLFRRKGVQRKRGPVSVQTPGACASSTWKSRHNSTTRQVSLLTSGVATVCNPWDCTQWMRQTGRFHDIIAVGYPT